MSIYLTTVAELAKKRGVPVDEFIKTLREIGIGVKSHTKKLTQEDLDLIAIELDGVSPLPIEQPKVEKRKAKNPNVIMFRGEKENRVVALVDAIVNEDGTISVEVLERSDFNNNGEALLEFRKLQGMNMGIN